MTSVSGTEGYSEEADELVQRYESTSFAEVHRSVLHLPTAPCWVLDIGSGTGRDAAALAAMGHRIVAVEPTAEMRIRAAALHPSQQIEWLDDSLPVLAQVTQLGGQFQLMMLTAIWMHLDEPQRRRAMPRVASLVRIDGVVSMTLRHGPVPRGRRMFEVSAHETIALAEVVGLRCLFSQERTLALKTPNVSWTRLVFAKPNEAA
jgi:2-polyprenyl-3-methyl-5-hydroxy-6-metoxy-1,4-benzoquinol methylase